MYGEKAWLGDFATMDNDDVRYVRSGMKVVEDFSLYYLNVDFETDVSSVFVMPGYPLFLAFFFKVFGFTGSTASVSATAVAMGSLAVRLAQGLLQFGVLVLLYRIGKRFFSVWTARLAVVFYMFYIPNLEAPLLILTEVVFTFLFVLLVYLCMVALETKRMTYYVWGGIVLGLAALFRPTILLFPLVILVIWLLLKESHPQSGSSIRKYSAREMLVRGFVVGCILMAMMAPWWIRNGVEFGRFIPMTEASGDPFMQGAFIDYDFDTMPLYTADLSPELDAQATDIAKMNVGKRRLQDSWQEDPLKTIHWYTVGKLKYLWQYPYYNFPGGQYVFGVSWNTMFRYHWLLLGLAGLGVVLNGFRGERNRRLKLLLPFSVVYMSAIYLPYFTCSRYAYPLMPIIFLLAACGVCSAARWLSTDLPR
ncbi:MAG: glycosyltransferase family 39 protein [Gracilibacteraceae bacterium]|nr:glycosyltransferase family 39 protein [Gracilibacteraceae bacterium]